MIVNPKLFAAVSGAKRWIALAMAAKLVVLLANIWFAFVVGDTLQALYAGEAMVASLRQLLITGAAVIILRFILNPVTAWLSSKGSSIARLRLRHAVYRKLLALETHYAKATGTSQAVSTAVDGVEALESYFSGYLPQLFYSLLAPLVLFAAIWPIDWRSATVLLAISPLIPLLLMMIMKIARQVSGKHFKSYQNLGSHFLESLQGLATLKLFNRDEAHTSLLREKTSSFRKATMRVLAMQLNSLVLIDLIAYGGAVAGITAAVVSYGKGDLTFGGAATIVLLAAEFFLPLRILSSLFHVAMNGVSASEKIFELLAAQEPAGKHGESETIVYAPPYRPSVRLENVKFSYDGRSQTLKGIDLSIEAGKTTAIVGKSGCGKSTVVSLLAGFLRPDSGAVLLDDVNVEAITVNELRSKICIVPQNTYIFMGSIADNLRMAKPNATAEEMLAACDAAGLRAFIESSAAGLDTEVGEGGARLSGGQRQKLGIARALLLDAAMYIFDEATSNVDAQSEEEIWQAIWNVTRQRTALIISHRLSSIASADCIYVMDSGIIADVGTHTQLMNKGGLYYELAVQQMEMTEGEVVPS